MSKEMLSWNLFSARNSKESSSRKLRAITYSSANTPESESAQPSRAGTRREVYRSSKNTAAKTMSSVGSIGENALANLLSQYTKKDSVSTPETTQSAIERKRYEKRQSRPFEIFRERAFLLHRPLLLFFHLKAAP